MQPDVSFVIAAFNAEETVARAIRSALRQAEVSVEIIVVDDRSSDATVERVRSVADSRVRIVELARNGGPGAARNAALNIAGGRWIAVLDSDDTIHPQRMARMIRRAEGAGAEIVVDNIEVLDIGEAKGRPMFAEAELQRMSRIGLADFIAGNRMFDRDYSLGYMKPVFLRAFIEEHHLRYDETLRIGEDYIFFASALAKGATCAVEPEPGYVYHIREGSISRVLELQHVRAIQQADAAFLSTHALDEKARAAQAGRTRSLAEAASFLTLVRHLKDRSALQAIRTALRDPMALRHLRMPIEVRLRRLAERRDPAAAAGKTR